MSEWGIINGNPIIFKMSLIPEMRPWACYRYKTWRTYYVIHASWFRTNFGSNVSFWDPKVASLKVQDAPGNGYDWERDNVNKKWGREKIGGWAEILVMILVGVGEKWWDYCIFCLSQQTAWAPAVTEVFSTSRWPVLPTSETGDQKNWAEFELLYIPLSLTVLHRAEKGKS